MIKTDWDIHIKQLRVDALTLMANQKGKLPPELAFKVFLAEVVAMHRMLDNHGGAEMNYMIDGTQVTFELEVERALKR